MKNQQNIIELVTRPDIRFKKQVIVSLPGERLLRQVPPHPSPHGARPDRRMVGLSKLRPSHVDPKTCQTEIKLVMYVNVVKIENERTDT